MIGEFDRRVVECGCSETGFAEGELDVDHMVRQRSLRRFVIPALSRAIFGFGF